MHNPSWGVFAKLSYISCKGSTPDSHEANPWALKKKKQNRYLFLFLFFLMVKSSRLHCRLRYHFTQLNSPRNPLLSVPINNNYQTDFRCQKTCLCKQPGFYLYRGTYSNLNCSLHLDLQVALHFLNSVFSFQN